MEAAISVIGLLAAGAQIYSSLDRLISTFSDAPLLAHTVCNEVRDFRYALSKLQPYVDGSVPIKLLGASMVDVHHLSLTLAAAVFTFSKLEKKLDRLLVRVPGETPEDRGTARGMDTLSRLKWLRDEGDVSQLVQHIQQHKSSLNLLLTVLISESLTEAKERRTKLEAGLTDIIGCLSGQHQLALQAQITEVNQSTSSINSLGRVMESDASSIMTVTSISSRFYHRSFESTLFASRPYRTMTSSSLMSSASSQRLGTRWSLYSGGSNTSVFSLPLTCFEPVGRTLAETSVRDIPLPILTDNLHNPWWYDSKTRPPRDLILLPSRTLSLVSLGLKSVESAFLEAVKSGNPEAIIRMLERGADIETPDSEGHTPVIWATQQNDERMVRIFLNEGANIDQVGTNGFTLLQNAITAGHREIIGLLLNRGAATETKDGGDPPLFCAIRFGLGASVIMLLDRGADIEGRDMSGCTPLIYAIQSSNQAMAQILVDRGADIDQRDASGRTPLIHAIQFGRKAVAEVLLDRGADIEARDASDRTLLIFAIGLGKKAMAEMLLDRGADIEGRDALGRTPLFQAIQFSGVAVVEMLLERGADIKGIDRFGRTPLFHATRFGKKAIVGILLDRGADIEGRDKSGRTPLIHAVDLGKRAMAEVLLDRGADIEGIDASGCNPLAHARYSVYSFMVRMLLDRGAGQ